MRVEPLETDLLNAGGMQHVKSVEILIMARTLEVGGSNALCGKFGVFSKFREFGRSWGTVTRRNGTLTCMKLDNVLRM